MIHFPPCDRTDPAEGLACLFLCLSPALFSAFLDVVKGSATCLRLKHLCTHQSWQPANHLFSCPQIPPAATLQVGGQMIMEVDETSVGLHGVFDGYQYPQCIEQ